MDPLRMRANSKPISTNWVIVVVMTLGLICAAYRLLARSLKYVALNIVLILFADPVWNWI
ncbi:MAG: hypothetical protein IKP20_03950 [Candidatus Methanomethylophilaceae archaeon]|nr:hypothetical protein [Candidatus Methanomethylophilaceae archaeon]